MTPEMSIGRLQHAPDCDQRDCFVVQWKKQETNTGSKPKMPDHYRCTITCAFCGKRKDYEDECYHKQRLWAKLKGEDPCKGSGKGGGKDKNDAGKGKSKGRGKGQDKSQGGRGGDTDRQQDKDNKNQDKSGGNPNPNPGGNAGCQTTPQNPRLCPPLLILYPPLFRSQTVLCFQQQVLMPSSPKLEIFGNLQGTRRNFFGFLRQSIGYENPFIFVGEVP